MFTGIIEKTTRVIGVADGSQIPPAHPRRRLVGYRAGQSVAVNGCCLTIAEINPGEISFDVIEETLARTNLGRLSNGDEETSSDRFASAIAWMAISSR